MRSDLQGLLAQASHNPSIHQVRRTGAFSGDIVDFCVPVNRYFPPPELLARLRDHLPDLLRHYPDTAEVHERHVAALIGVPADQVVVANGSTEIITALCQQATGPMLTTVPTFGRWTDLPREHGTPLHVIAHPREHDWRLDAGALIEAVQAHGARQLVLCNPNNPTGAAFADDQIVRLIEALPALDRLVIDESFIDFSTLTSARHRTRSHANTVVVTSLGKSLGWHGIRLGYAVAHPQVAAELRARLPWWNVNALAGFVLQALAESPTLREDWHASFERIAEDRRHLLLQLRQLPGLTAWDSQANFVYVALPHGVSGRDLRAQLLADHGVYVRDCGNKLGASASYLRLAVLPPAETARLIAALREALAQPLRAQRNPM